MDEIKNATRPGDTILPTPFVELQALVQSSSSGSKYTVEDFFRKPEKSQFQLSPQGGFFSFLGPYSRRLNIFIQKIGENEGNRITSVTDRDIAWYFWKNENRLLFAKDESGNENYHLFAVNRDGTDLVDLTPFPGVRMDLVDDLEDEENEIIIQMNKNNPQLFEPYRLNINTGELRQLAENTNPIEPIDNWMADHNGKLMLASKITGGTNTTIMYRKSETEPFKEVFTSDFRENVSPLFFDFDNGSIIYVSSNLDRDKSVIVKMDLTTGKETGEPIYSHPAVDVNNLSYSRKRKVLTSVTYVTDRRHFFFLDEWTKNIFTRLQAELGDYEIVITAMSRAEDKMMVRTYSDKSLGSYYFLNVENNELIKIADVSPWLDEKDMAPMKPVAYTSRDGLTIRGYLTLPTEVENKNLPIIINPHGGPWVRDAWGYNPEVQLLVSQGYGVLQMNYRGSTGYGREFWELGFKQWGKKMQDDITDGVNWLIHEGIADPGRVAIYGGSYGGYATLAGVAFTPELYACAIDYVGVSNLFTFMNTIPPYWKPYLEMMYEMVGDPEKDKDDMYAASPVFHASKIKTPLFVIQGANDPRVNIDESDQIVRSLRERNVDVPYLVKYDEGHGFQNEENQFEVYKAMLGFLAKYLK